MSLYCNKLGHIQRECGAWKREQNEGKKKEKETNAVTTECDATIVYKDGCVNLTSQESDWAIDSSASSHDTPHGDFFSTYSTGDFGDVRMGNSSASKIMGIRDI